MPDDARGLVRLRPPRLRQGDRVAIVAPASPIERAACERGARELERLGFVPVLAPQVFARHGYVAGPPTVRAEALLEAFAAPEIAAIIAARGGYGSAQMLPYLDPAVVRRHPKVFIGYSDTTALLGWLTAQGLTSFHGPMLEGRLERGPEAYDATSLLAAVTSPEPMGALTPPGLEVITSGEASGLLCGGTLTQLAASLGTPWAFRPPEGAVLLLEDVGERPYRLDRLCTQLHQAGVFSGVRGIVLGEFPRCDEPGGTPSAREVLRALFAGFPGPVVFGFPSGHTHGPSLTVPFGVRARLVTDPSPALIIDEGAVA